MPERSETPRPQVDAPSNLTRAFITGKIPDAAPSLRGRSGKRGKISGSRKRHVASLKQHGAISQSVASRHGL